MEGCTSVENCQGNSLSVEGGPGENKKSSWFSKLKISWKENGPDGAPPTGLQSSMKATGKCRRRFPSDIGRICSKRLRSLKIPWTWRRRLRTAADRIRVNMRRTGQICRRRMRFLRISSCWRTGPQTAANRIRVNTRRTGKVSRRRMRFLRIPSSWQRGLQTSAHRNRGATRRIWRTRSKSLPSLKIPSSWPRGQQT
jgi:hypothetical protein